MASSLPDPDYKWVENLNSVDCGLKQSTLNGADKYMHISIAVDEQILSQ